MKLFLKRYIFKFISKQLKYKKLRNIIIKIYTYIYLFIYTRILYFIKKSCVVNLKKRGLIFFSKQTFQVGVVSGNVPKREGQVGIEEKMPIVLKQAADFISITVFGIACSKLLVSSRGPMSKSNDYYTPNSFENIFNIEDLAGRASG